MKAGRRITLNGRPGYYIDHLLYPMMQKIWLHWWPDDGTPCWAQITEHDFKAVSQ